MFGENTRLRERLSAAEREIRRLRNLNAVLEDEKRFKMFNNFEKQRIPADLIASGLNKPGIRVDSAQIIPAADHFNSINKSDSINYLKYVYPILSDNPNKIISEEIHYNTNPEDYCICNSIKDYASHDMGSDVCDYVLDLRLFLTTEKLYEIFDAQGFCDGVRKPSDYSINELLKIIKKKVNERNG